MNLGIWSEDTKLFGAQHVRLVDVSKVPAVELTWSTKYAPHLYFGNPFDVPDADKVTYPTFSVDENQTIIRCDLVDINGNNNHVPNNEILE